MVRFISIEVKYYVMHGISLTWLDRFLFINQKME
jgi:hypothetical protein